jgi:sec-independent protein translocase protein TatA
MNYAIIEDISAVKLLIVLLIVLVIFGPSRLPRLGRSLGSAVREFKGNFTQREGSKGTDSSSNTTARSARNKTAQPLLPPGELEPVGTVARGTDPSSTEAR